MKVYSYDFYWSEHLASTFKVRAQAFLFLCASRGLRRADLASGMSLTLFGDRAWLPISVGTWPGAIIPSAWPGVCPLGSAIPSGVWWFVDEVVRLAASPSTAGS